MNLTDRTPIDWRLDSDPSIRWQVTRLSGARSAQNSLEGSDLREPKVTGSNHVRRHRSSSVHA